MRRGIRLFQPRRIECYVTLALIGFSSVSAPPSPLPTKRLNDIPRRIDQRLPLYGSQLAVMNQGLHLADEVVEVTDGAIIVAFGHLAYCRVQLGLQRGAVGRQ